MTVPIETECEFDPGFDYTSLITDVVRASLDEEDCPYEAEVDVLLTDSASIRDINREQRGMDAATDVLSFPNAAYPAPGDFSKLEEDPSLFHPETGELLLGDMVISVEKAREQAALYGHSLRRELAFLTAHSMFHLMGYDHENEKDAAVMEAKEEAVLASLGLTRDCG